jgi:hypothetical protein
MPLEIENPAPTEPLLRISECFESAGANMPVTCPGLKAVDMATLFESNAAMTYLGFTDNIRIMFN